MNIYIKVFISVCVEGPAFKVSSSLSKDKKCTNALDAYLDSSYLIYNANPKCWQKAKWYKPLTLLIFC